MACMYNKTRILTCTWAQDIPDMCDFVYSVLVPGFFLNGETMYKQTKQ